MNLYNNLYNRVCEVLDIEVPIIQAGMAGDRITTVELIVNVCEAGGLGTLGAAYMQPEDIRQTVQEIRKDTDKTLLCYENSKRAGHEGYYNGYDS